MTETLFQKFVCLFDWVLRIHRHSIGIERINEHSENPIINYKNQNKIFRLEIGVQRLISPHLWKK
jgi:hypothetical protein